MYTERDLSGLNTDVRMNDFKTSQHHKTWNY